MKFFQLPFLVSLPFLGVQSLKLLDELHNCGLDGFASFLQQYGEELLSRIDGRNNVTVWAPSNSAVSSFNHTLKRDILFKRGNPSDSIPGQVTCPSNSQTPPPGDFILKEQKLRRENSGDASSNNSKVIISFLDNPAYANLGFDPSSHQRERVRWVENQAQAPNLTNTNPGITQISTGLGTIINALRGPCTYDNGVIYEVDSFFTLPQSFSQTLQQLTTAQQFYNTIVSSGNLPFFESTPALTVFAPVDTSNPSCGNSAPNPKAHAIANFLGYTPELTPGLIYVTESRNQIKFTRSNDGQLLVNGQRFIKPNVITENGVVHFVEGRLDCNSTSSPTSTPIPASFGTAPRSAVAKTTGVLLAAIGASLLLVI